MSDQRPACSVVWRFLGPAVLVASAAAIVYSGQANDLLTLSPAAGANGPARSTAPSGSPSRLTDDQVRLVDCLVESASAASQRATPIRVAIFDAQGPATSGTEKLASILEPESAYRPEIVSAAEVRAGALEPFDVVLFPGGSGSKQAAALEEDGKQAVREFVRSGGGFVGVCGGAFLATARYDWSLALVNVRTITGKREIPGKGTVSMAARGAGTAKMELTDAGRRVFSNFPTLVDVRYAGGPILLPGARDDLPEYVCLARYRTDIWAYEPQRGTMIDTAAIVAGRFGEGRVIVFSPHPESFEATESLVKQAVRSVARAPVQAD